MAMGDSTVNVTIGATLATTFSKAFFDAEKTTKKLGAAVTQLNRATGNIQNLKKTQMAVSRASREYKTAKKTLDDLNRRLRRGETQTDEFTDAWVEAQERFEKAKLRLKNLNQELHQHKKAAGNAKASTASLIANEKRLESQLRRTQQVQERYNRTMQRSNDLKSRAGKLAMAGAGMAAGAYLMGRTMAAPIREGYEFGAAVSNVKAIANQKGAFATLEEAQNELVKKIKMLGATTSFTASEVAGGAKFLTMAGFDISQTIGALPATLSLSRAGDLSLDRTADIMSNIMTPFKIHANQSSDVADKLAAVVTTANTDISMLGETMKYVAPSASMLGLSMADTAAMAGILAKAGIQASMAGTSLRQIMNKLAAPAGKGAKRIQELGVVTTDAAGNLRHPAIILKEMGESMENLGFASAKKAEYLKDIFGLLAISGSTTLVDAAASGELNQYITTIRNAEKGLSDRIARERMDNLQGDATKLGSAVSGMFLTLYDSIKPMLRSIVTGITSVVNSINNWAKEHPFLTKVVMLTGVAVTTLTAGMAAGLVVTAAYTFAKSKLLAVNGALALSLRRTAVGVGSLGAIMAASKAGFVATIGKVKALGSAFLWLNRAAMAFMISNPIGWVIGGLALLGAAIYKYWQPLKLIGSGFWEGLSEGIAPIFEALKPVGEVLENIGKAIVKILKPMGVLKEDMSGLKAIGYTLGKALSVLLWPLQEIAKVIGHTAELINSIGTIGWSIGKWFFGDDEPKKTTTPANSNYNFAQVKDSVLSSTAQAGAASANSSNYIDNLRIIVNGNADPVATANEVMRRQQEELARIARERND